MKEKNEEMFNKNMNILKNINVLMIIQGKIILNLLREIVI